jgi:hypothetical protein
MAARPRLSWAALGFGLAALLSSWTAAAAPFGLAVGLASVVIAVRALRAGGRRSPAVAGLLLALAAVAVSGVELALTAGLGRQGQGATLIPQPPAGQAGAALDAAAASTREARERAAGELEGLRKPWPRAPAD